ncbi:MAG: amylosucrase [Myxococcota bacterium]|nr:amylosucrase [Myxococcota bacterium]
MNKPHGPDATKPTPAAPESMANTNDFGDAFAHRRTLHWPHLAELLHAVYADRPDLEHHLAALDTVCRSAWADRSNALRLLDAQREANPNWFSGPNMVGMSLYVDLFADDFQGVRAKIPYLVDLGITFVHLMPLFEVPDGPNDGGYAVKDYRVTRANLGTMEELRALIDALRQHGIAVAIDFIFNHTADDHAWARAAKAGDGRFSRFFYTFDDRDVPSAYEQNLREIFPETRRGSFSWHAEVGRWVWTTFNSYQWDLNYANPDVFIAMAAEMLFLANLGVDVLRLDAVAFVWKRMGTTCENLPEAHLLIQALNAVCRIAAPSVAFKSEAIVHPDDVARYISPSECQLSYNPTLMALLWEAAATRETRLLRQSLSHRQALPAGTTWVNYLRCHDDIGWSFDDADARTVGIDPSGHRQFLNRFFTGKFPGSFARGVPFQFNPANHDVRVCGTFASLVGFEDAERQASAELFRMALARARVLFGVLMSVGGIPLIFSGEECGALNNYHYTEVPEHQDDARWAHRSRMTWASNSEPVQSDLGLAITAMLRDLVRTRKASPALSGTVIEVMSTPSPHCLAYWRRHEGQTMLVIANFSESPVPVQGGLVRVTDNLGPLVDTLSGAPIESDTLLEPYALHWCQVGQ